MSPQVPLFVSIAFLVAIGFPVYMIASLFSKHVKPSLTTKAFWGIIAFFVVYFTGVGIAAFGGVFEAVSIPPKIVQVTTLPLLLLLMVVVFNTNGYKCLLRAIPVDRLIIIHRFRLIGSFFIILLLFDQLPPFFALIAGIGDVFTALSSIWVAKAWKEKKYSRKTIALAWNTFGLIDILFTASMATILTKISIETGSLGVDILAAFPFCFIPAFAPPTIIFLHMSIYRKLLTKNFS